MYSIDGNPRVPEERYHRAAIVQQAAEAMDIPLQRLSEYSPDFMPLEHLWQ
jgi:hypothetical protein